MEPELKHLVQLLPLLPVLAELGRTGHITATAEILGVPAVHGEPGRGPGQCRGWR